MGPLMLSRGPCRMILGDKQLLPGQFFSYLLAGTAYGRPLSLALGLPPLLRYCWLSWS